MRFIFLSLLSFLLQTIGLIIFFGLGLIGYTLWDSYGMSEWEAIQADIMLIWTNETYRKWLLATLGCVLLGSLFMGLGELLRVFFNIEKNTKETTALLFRQGRSAPTSAPRS